jgi:colanic acid/amylovoran biosynthesis glycosyltransferase
VVIYCDHLLYPSQTFIRSQVGALRRFAPVYAGSRRVPGLDLPLETTYTISKGDTEGRVREVLFKLFGIAPNLEQQLRALDPVLLHAHFGWDGFRALLLAQRLNVPLIVTFHGSDATVTDLRYAKTYYGYRRYLANKGKLQKEASLFLAVSEFIRRKLLEQGFPDDKVLVHYIGVDTKIFSPQKGESAPIVLFVGRLVERKGASYLIRAMAEVQQEHPEAELVLIGEGPLRRDLEAQAKSSLRRYRFLGVQKPEVVLEWMDRAAVFCAPSITTRSGETEAFGIVFAEAQALQKPVVSFASGGIGEAVSHGETGLLAPERDWQELAKYLATLLQNPDLRRKFGIAGRQRVLRLFELAKQTSALETIYQQVAERAHGLADKTAGGRGAQFIVQPILGQGSVHESGNHHEC